MKDLIWGSNLHLVEGVMIVGSFITSYLIGDWVPLMMTLVIFNGVDIVTGLLNGIDSKTITSKLLYKGFMKKVGQWLLLIVAHHLDVIAFDGNTVLVNIVLGFLIGSEGLSITENLGKMGIIIPPEVTKYLKQVKESDKQKEIIAEAKAENENNDTSV